MDKVSSEEILARVKENRPLGYSIEKLDGTMFERKRKLMDVLNNMVKGRNEETIWWMRK